MRTSFAPAKVNLYLHVTGKRADGYHLLDSLAIFPDIGDVISVEPADDLTLAISGPYGAALATDPDNLILRAARALDPATTAALTLTKNLPIASGIGGGSADAAATLRLLSHHDRIKSPSDLTQIAASLGADIPVCLARIPARMSGIGDILHPAPKLPDLGIILVNPGIAVPTPAVFRARKGGVSRPASLPARWETTESLATDLRHLANDLEPPAIAIAPVIADVLAAIAALPGCHLARMSGSGATCFGLFTSPASATAAAAKLTPTNWWHWSGGLYEPHPTDL